MTNFFTYGGARNRLAAIVLSTLFCLVYFSGILSAPTVTPLSTHKDSKSSAQHADTEWPHTPFHTKDTQILNSINQPINLAGVNWPGHGLPMIPEGLQYSSIHDVVAKIKGLGMNVVRLTYAIEMIDDIYDNHKQDVKLKESMVKALGQRNGSRVYQDIIRLNPDLKGSEVTRLDVFDAVAAELARQNIYVHLDNHISKAGWCCGLEDGNGWFGDKYFSPTNWTRGITYMTAHASKWKSFTSTSLRNELRDTPSNPSIHATYNWSTWYDHMIPAVHAVHKSNPDALVFVSGMEYDRSLEPVINRQDLGGGRIVNLADFPSSLREKLVWEIHNYNNSIESCSALERQLFDAGYSILEHTGRTDSPLQSSAVNLAPIVLSEFGFAQDPTSSQGPDSIYAQCLKRHLRSVNGSWMYWVIVGSYYEREGIQDFDESWGMLTKDWKEWRSPEIIETYFRPLVKETLGND